MLAQVTGWIGERHRTRAYLAPLLVGLVGVTAFVYVALVDPNEHGNYPTCPWLLATGYYCPGCGFLRMVHAIGHAQFGTAFGLNALAFVMLPVLLFAWGRWLVRSIRGRPRETVLHPAFIWAFLAILIGFWIVRNLPVGAALAP